MTLSPTTSTSVTADLYKIRIDDRIVLSGRFDADNYPALGNLLSGLGVGQAQFFVNSVNTETKGFDLTASQKTDLGGGKLTTFLALNLSKTTVVGIKAPKSLAGFEDVLLSERERLFIEQGGPRSKATLDFNYVTGKLESDFKIIRFGSQTLGTFSGTAAGVPNAYYAPKTSADLAFTWAFDSNTKLTVGGANIFNVKPSKQDPNETDNGFIYDSVQFGLNGASYFVRFWKKF
jgi:iron complex outermembrane receptor protein